MSKADRRRRAGRKLKQDVKRHPNGEPAHSIAVDRMREFVEAARARKSKITGRDDLPPDVLGILFGHGRIKDEEYHIGRKLEGLMNRIYGSPHGSASGLFREVVSPPNAEDAERNMEPMTDKQAEDKFRDMDKTLRNCGLVVHNVTIAAARYCRFPQNEAQISMIKEGLSALAKGHAPRVDHRRLVVHQAA